MREVELKLLSQLMKNSRKSDRDLAKAIDISPNTVTRLRRKLEKEGHIREYTIIPDFAKLGYHLLALTFVKPRKTLTPEEVDEARRIAQERAKESPLEIIMIEAGLGLGYTAVIISFHENYESYIELKRRLKSDKYLEPDMESFLVSLDGAAHYKSLTFTTLANHISRLRERA